MSGTYSYKTCINCGNVGRRHGHKFCSNTCQLTYQYKLKVEQWLSGELSGKRGKTSTAAFIKRYFVEKNGHKCERCGLTEWMGQPIPIQLHHKDGKFDNNDPNNLELLCGNCHLQTPNFGKKNKYGRPMRRKYWRNMEDG